MTFIDWLRSHWHASQLKDLHAHRRRLEAEIRGVDWAIREHEKQLVSLGRLA